MNKLRYWKAFEELARINSSDSGASYHDAPDAYDDSWAAYPPRILAPLFRRSPTLRVLWMAPIMRAWDNVYLKRYPEENTLWDQYEEMWDFREWAEFIPEGWDGDGDTWPFKFLNWQENLREFLWFAPQWFRLARRRVSSRSRILRWAVIIQVFSDYWEDADDWVWPLYPYKSVILRFVRAVENKWLDWFTYTCADHPRGQYKHRERKFM